MKFQLLLAELKRRKVLRVAATFGATAFVLLQVADIVFPALHLPPWTMTLLVALALIGFLMAVVLAWTFESTDEGLRRTAPARAGELEAIVAAPRSRRWPAGLAALLGMALLGAGAVWALGGGGGRAEAYDSIAVLPFANLSGNVDNEYFGDGLAEELLNALAGIEGLKVAARTSAFAFKNTSVDVRQIGDTLGVATVLEGSVRRSADRVRITAQLIDARTGYHVWSETYDRPLTDLFAVQDAIAAEIVDALAPRFTPSRAGLYRGGTRDVEAYDLYLLGRQKWATRDVPLLREAIGHFEAAIARDSSFALAWSGLADAIDALAWRSPDALDRVPEAKYAAQRAVLLDPELAEGWASLAVLALDYDRDFRSAELGLRRAIALRPSNATAHQWLADALRHSGRVEEALEPGARAIELDPMNTLGMTGRFNTLVVLGRWREARALADRMRAVRYPDIGSLPRLIWAGPQLGFTADSLASFSIEWARGRGYSRPEESDVIGRAIVDPTRRAEARRVLQRMDAERLNARDVAALFVAVGDPESALASLERGLADHEPTMISIVTDRVFDPLRSDARFIRIRSELLAPAGR